MRRIHQRNVARAGADVVAAPALQRRIADVASVPSGLHYSPSAVQRAPAGGGKALPGGLRNGIEALSGISMSDVVVHRHSSKPAELGAHAYTQGSAIYLAPSQERHLPHEAWHVVQQRQGRVKPTMQMRGGTRVNDDPALESEADVMGGKALQAAARSPAHGLLGPGADNPDCVQRVAKLAKTASLQDILNFLQEAIISGEVISKEDQKTISGIVSRTRRARQRDFFASYDSLYRQAEYEDGGVIQKALYESSEKKPKKKRRRLQNAPPEVLFSDDESSDESDGELDPGELYKRYPKLYQPAIDHSDYHRAEDSINPRNTNMLAFRDRSLIPSSINGRPNVSATRKRKRKLAEKLGEGPLRSKQEQVYFGSHLKLDSEGDFDDGFESLKKRIKTEEGSRDPVRKLATTSRRGFSIRDTEGHAEQSLLRSKIWEALKAKLIKQFAASVDSDGDAALVTLMLNRSSCRGCALALSVALIQFWQQVASATGGKLSWREAKKKYGARIRFVIRFPTIYEYDKEKRVDFANLREILAALHDAGWEIAPFVPDIQGGMDSYNQLVASLKELGMFPDKAGFEFYKSGGSGGSGGIGGIGGIGNAPPQPSAQRVPQQRLQAYLTSIDAGWDQPFQNVPGNGAQQMPNLGFMAQQIQPQHQALALPIVLGRRENRTLAPHRLQVWSNGGQGALCFVYAVLMGLTGESEQAVAPMARYIAAQAHAVGGWITVDSQIAANVVAQVEHIYGVNVDVVAIQHGVGATLIAGRAGHLGGRTVVIRQTPGHYDAYIPN